MTTSLAEWPRRPPRERQTWVRFPVFCVDLVLDLKIGGPVDILAERRYTVTGELETLICNFCLSVAASTILLSDPSLRYTGMYMGWDF